jgi:predicted TIM-barrel fold metal-dependent hydrolase
MPLTLLATFMLSPAWSQDAIPSININDEPVVVIDLHLHTGEWDRMPPAFQERVSERIPTGFKWTAGPFANWMLSIDTILSQLESAGIWGGGLFALYSPHTTGNAPNAYVASRVAEANGRLWGFASIRVDDWNNNSAAELAAFEQSFADHPELVGIKLAHAHQQFRLDDERFYPIYEIAGRLGKPMYLHTGTSPNPGTRYEPEYSDPAYLEEAIQKYPEAIFILGHTGYDSKDKALTYTSSAIRLAQQYANVYVEPGALGATRAENLIDDFVVRMKESNILHKVIYGSDGVQFPGYVTLHLENYVAAMQRNGYTVAEMKTVLAENFAKLFNVELPQVAATAGETP